MKKKISHVHNVTWLDAEAPNQELIEMLRQRYNFNALDVMYHQAELRISKFDMHQRYLFLVVQIPTHYGVGIQGAYELKPRELEIFLGPDFIVTIHKEPFDELESVFRAIEQDMARNPSPLKQTPGYVLYQLLLALSEISMDWLVRTKKDIDEIKKFTFAISYSYVNIQKAHNAIASLEQQMARLHSMMAPQREVISRLMSVDMAFMSLALQVYGNELYQRIEHIVQESYLEAQILRSLQQAEQLRVARLQFKHVHEIATWVMYGFILLIAIGLFASLELALTGLVANAIGFLTFAAVLVVLVGITNHYMKKK